MEDMKKEMGTETRPSSWDKAMEFCEEERGAWIIAGAILLGSLIIAATLLVSVKPKTGVANTDTTQPTAAAPQVAPGNTNATVSIENAPLMGDKTKAKMAIVEFSDYECPFCKQFHQDTFDQIVKDYVTTGKAVIAYRNFPLPFHEPKASIAAETAQCVRSAKGDTAYFAFGKAYFKATQANGKGLPDGTTLDSLITAAGANAGSVDQCATSEKFKAQIQKDQADGQAAGVSGTPSFVIGKLGSDGKVTGELLVGAQPYVQFKTTLDKYLQ